MPRLRSSAARFAGALALVVTGAAAGGCGNRGSVTFNLKAPSNALFNPVAQPELVSEYDIRTASGAVIGIASAVQGSAQSTDGRLPLGALMPTMGPEDVYVTVLSGGNLLGEARIRDVSIKGGAQASYDAELRKPLVFVGSSIPPEMASGDRTLPVEILDPNASIDLAKAPGTPPVVTGGMTAGAVTWDGRFLVAAQGTQLAAFDTGLGRNVTGTLTLPFAPVKVAVAPRNLAIVALDATGPTDGALAIIADVAGFVAAPSTASPQMVKLMGQLPRTVAFSPDGTKMYVLSGGPTVDPCAPGAMTTPNAIYVFGLDGAQTGSYPLEGFASDIAVDPDSGEIVVADASAKQLETIDPASGAMKTVPGSFTCPSAVRVVNGVAFAVTSDRDTSQANAWVLQRVTLKTGQATALSFIGPNYNIPIDSMPSQNGNIQTATLPVRPTSITAYELAITPDGSRAEFATRARYQELGTKFQFSGEDCTANFDIVEYGLYAVDIRTGNASYQQRAQLVQMPAGGSKCVDCSITIFGSTEHQYADCASTTGDRPSGLAAAFGQ